MMRFLAVRLLLCTFLACSQPRSQAQTQNWTGGFFDQLGKYVGASVTVGRDDVPTVVLQDGCAMASVRCKDANCSAFDVTRLPDARDGMVTPLPVPPLRRDGVSVESAGVLWSAMQPTGKAVSVYRGTEPLWTAEIASDTIAAATSVGDGAWFALLREDTIRLIHCAGSSCEARGTARAEKPRFLTMGAAGDAPFLAFESEDVLLAARCADRDCAQMSIFPVGHGTPHSVAAAADGSIWIAYTSGYDIFKLARCADRDCATVTLPRPAQQR